MSDPVRAEVPREPGEAKCPMVTAGVEGGRSAGTGARARRRSHGLIDDSNNCVAGIAED